jgi:uncharacterized protein YjdB
MILVSVFAVGCHPVTSLSDASSVTPVSSAVASSVYSKEDIPAAGITLDPTEITLRPGETADIKATVTPENTTDPTVTWSSSSASVATVDASGKVTGIAPGTALVTAKAGTVSATCKVTVENSYPVSISLDSATAFLEIGGTQTLTATVAPQMALQDVVFASDDEKIATVSEAGAVTGVDAGTAHITVSSKAKAKDGKAVSASCAVIVSYQSITSFTATADKTVLYPEDTAVITPAIAPVTADPHVTYVSSDTAVLTVDDQGKVTAVAYGKASVIVIPNGDPAKNVKISFTVQDFVTQLTVTPETMTLNAADTKQITVSVLPATAPLDVTYTSADPTVATVSPTGLVTAVKAGGTTTITVATSGITAEKAEITKTVTVKIYDSVTGVTISEEHHFVSMNVNKTMELKAAVSPSTADPNVTWTSSDTSIATVSGGVVTSKALGKVTITAASVGKDANGAVVQGTYAVSVDEVVTKFTAFADKTTIKIGETTHITTAVYVGDGTVLALNQKAIFEELFLTYVSITDTGDVTGIARGNTYIMVYPEQAPQANYAITIEIFITEADA